MARPKNTRTTKWIIASESWYPTREEASKYAKMWKAPTEIKHIPNAKTMHGYVRGDKWRLRMFRPTMYRGRKVVTNVIKPSNVKSTRKYHKHRVLAQIRGGGYVYLGEQVTHARRKKRKKKRR